MTLQKIIAHKNHLLSVALLFLLTCILLKDYVAMPYWIPMRGDPELSGIGTDFVYHASNFYILKEGFTNGNIPLWSPYIIGGMPFFAKPQLPVFNLSWLLLLIAPTAYLALKWTFLLYYFLGGLGVYLFMILYLKQSKKISFFSAVIYMLNVNFYTEVIGGHLNVVNVYTFLPYLLLCVLLALTKKNFITYSILGGLVFSLLILGGSAQETLFVIVAVCVILGFHCIGKNIVGKLIKAVMVGAIVLSIFIGIAAIKLIPAMEMVKITGTRQAGMGFENLAGDTQFTFPDIAKTFTNLLKLFGIAGFIFIPFSLLSIKKKTVLLIIVLLIFSLFILNNSPLIFALWKYMPFVNKMRGIFKVTFLFAFPAALLIGVGLGNLKSVAEEQLKLKNRYLLHGIYFCALALVLIQLAYFGQPQTPFADIKTQLEKNEIMKYMSSDTPIFRFKQFETNGIDWGTDLYSIPFHLEDIYGYDNTWNFRYLPIFLSATNSKPAKMFGILNLKYITATQPITISGFTLVQKFNECGVYPNNIDICQPKKSDGPYLYRNDLFLPRAYFADKSILILGERAKAENAVYQILLNDNFNPADAMVVGAESLSQIEYEPLHKFYAVFLLQSPSQQDVAKLQEYVNKGGRLLPNIFAGQNQISEEEIQKLIAETKSNYSQVKKADFSAASTDRISIKTQGLSGLLFVSEQFSQYPGWHAYADGKILPLMNANNILTGIYVPQGTDTVTFTYTPSSFTTGARIALITLILAIAGLVLANFKTIFRQHLKSA